jgi:hypothetical protein
VQGGDDIDTIISSPCFQKILKFLWQKKKSDTVKGFVCRIYNFNVATTDLAVNFTAVTN